VGGLNDTPAQEFEDDRIDYRLAGSFFATDSTTLYASIATGYKAGGVNARPFFAEQQLSHNPEEVLSYEIGAKTELFDDTLRLNSAVFFNDYSDVIVSLFECTQFTGAPFGSPCFLPVNAGEAEVLGFELEFDWAPTDGLTIDGSYGYIDFEYQSGALPTSTVQPFTPESTWSLGAQYEWDTPWGFVTPRLDVAYQDDMFSAPGNNAFDLIESRTLVNGSIRWTAPDESWMIALEGQNLTDEYYLAQQVDFTQGGQGSAYGNPGLPRTWMLTFRGNF
jgi:iron complex outermembrane receptor protein